MPELYVILTHTPRERFHMNQRGKQQAIYSLRNGYPWYMTKRLIDVDDEKLAAVRDLFGTTTLKATVNTALEEVLALDKRRRVLLEARGVDLAKMADEEARRAAWG